MPAQQYLGPQLNPLFTENREWSSVLGDTIMVLQTQVISEASSRNLRGGIRRKFRFEVDAAVPHSDATTVTIHNLSETGVLLETSAHLTKGELIELDLPHSGAKSAVVVWSSEQFFGCNFTEDLSVAAASATVLRAPFEILRADRESKVELEAEAPEDKLSCSTRLWTVIALALFSWEFLAGLAVFVV